MLTQATTCNSGQRRRRGFTLMEMLVATAIGGIVMVAIAMVSFYTSRSFWVMINYAELETQSRVAIDRISQKLRMADSVTSFATNEIVVVYAGKKLAYTYYPERKELVEEYDDVETTLLQDCTLLTFDVFKRNPMNGTFDYYPTATTISEAKLVRVAWRSARTVLGVHTTEELVSARIVLRKP